MRSITGSVWLNGIVMSVEDSSRVSLTTDPSFWELFVGSLVLIRYQGWRIGLHAAFPLAGVLLLTAPLTTGHRLELVQIPVALLAFSFTPLVTALAIWSVRRRNKLAQGPFRYAFDAEGMHTSGPAFEQTIRWSAIRRIRRSKRFLFIFLSPVRACCIPLRSFSKPEDLDRLRRIAGEHTDFR
jgi:hypothetical protein